MCILQTFSSLKTPNFRKWIYGQSITVFGNWMQLTAQGFLIYDLTKSAMYLGITAFAGGVSAWFFTLFAGVVADRFPRREILLFSQIGSMILAIIMALLTFTKIVEPWHIILLTFLLGTINAFESPARQAFVNDIVDRENVGNAISLNSSVFNLGTTLGPALSGIVYLAAGPSLCFTLNAFSFLPLILVLSMLDIPRPDTSENRRTLFVDIKEGVGYSINHKVVRPVIAVVIITSAFGFSIFSMLPAWAVSILHGNAGTNGFLQSARGIGALSGAITMASLGPQFRKGRFLCAGALAFPFLLLGFALSGSLIVSSIFILLTGICFVTIYNAANTLLQCIVHDELRGRVMSVYMLAFSGMAPLGSLFCGYFSDVFGERMSIVFCSIFAFLFIIPVIFFSPGLREQ